MPEMENTRILQIVVMEAVMFGRMATYCAQLLTALLPLYSDI